MPFSPNNVGLIGQTILSDFGEVRDGCPHKGIDITSSKKPMQFTAGVYGIVGNPTGGDSEWGTITVNPLNAPQARVQYLHCSNINVVPGQQVMPWTIIGTTGNTAPVGSGITGIHLHLQVEAPGTGAPACWKGRFFVNPRTFPTPDFLSGTWLTEGSRQQGIVRVDYRTFYSFRGASLGVVGRVRSYQTAYYESCKWAFVMDWDVHFNSLNQNGTINASVRNGTANRPVSCNITGGWTAANAEGIVTFQNQNSIVISGTTGAGQTYRRVGKHVNEFDNEFGELHNTFTAQENDEFLAASSASIDASFDPFEINKSDAEFQNKLLQVKLANSSDVELGLHHGVLPGEIF
jgi:hypothetical protein